MATFSSVSRQHVLQALTEYDDRGADAFRDLYGFDASTSYTLIHEGRTYDLRAVLGVAHRFATGRLATAEEFGSGSAGAVAILRKRGFDVTEPAGAVRPVPVKAPRAPRTSTPRATTTRSTAAAREVPPKLCPTCSMTLPSTGVCDYCA